MATLPEGRIRDLVATLALDYLRNLPADDVWTLLDRSGIPTDDDGMADAIADYASKATITIQWEAPLMASEAEYARLKVPPEACGWRTGKAHTGASVCGRTATGLVDSKVIVGGKVCDMHGKTVEAFGGIVTPITGYVPTPDGEDE